MIREKLSKAVLITKMLDNQNVYTDSERISGVIEKKRFELEELTDALESESNWTHEEIVLLVNNIPTSDDLADEASTFGSIVVNTGHFPLAEIWMSESFSEELDTLKASMFECGILEKKDGCRFSFTNDVLLGIDDISRILSADLNCLSRIDLNNILALTSFCDLDEISYPENYEELMIKNFKETHYSNYDKTVDRHLDFLEEHKLHRILEYISSLS